MVMNTKEKSYIKKEIDKLPPELVKEVWNFIEFLIQKEKRKKWIEFDEWAVNLAKERGFSHLTEEDISKIVTSYRESK
ncbi:MAG: DUF2281 domain-containing protein [Candidatus Cloacimonadota bacterium]|nr:MAG: DUF2281 domain-containing protein [Candidatus Cloacimonadota bacterium]